MDDTVKHGGLRGGSSGKIPTPDKHGLVPIKRVLISTANKEGLLPFARKLTEHGCRLYSTGGTRKFLGDGGVECLDVSVLSGEAEGFGGRVKTLSFPVMAALLYDRINDRDEALSRGVEPIDMVVCNFYPLPPSQGEESGLGRYLDGVDIGGPAMVRAGAKNGKWVAVLSDPADYPGVGDEMDRSGGCLSLDTRMALVEKAFNVVTDYDGAIATGVAGLRGNFSLRLAYGQVKALPYGENPHQKARLLGAGGAGQGCVGGMEVVGGSKELSWNNFHDLFAAIGCVDELPLSGCAVVKHGTPCGMAMGQDQGAVLAAAWEGDPVSAFGSVIAFNRPLTLSTVRYLELDHRCRSSRKFVEAVAAPEFEPGVVEYLGNLASLRVVRWSPDSGGPLAGAVMGADPGDGRGGAGWSVSEWAGSRVHLIPGGALVQTGDHGCWSELEVVAGEVPGGALDRELLRFGVIASRQVKSNGIVVVVRNGDGLCQVLGVGGGQPNRVQAARLALDGAVRTSGAGGGEQIPAGAWLVSDGFIPFPDTVELAAQYGVKLILQPGGSIRDGLVIQACDELGLTTVFTGMRHFLH